MKKFNEFKVFKEIEDIISKYEYGVKIMKGKYSNFLHIKFKSPTISGGEYISVGGTKTMTGQDIDNAKEEAKSMAKKIMKIFTRNFDLEDGDIAEVDNNYVIDLFLVSDEFIEIKI